MSSKRKDKRRKCEILGVRINNLTMEQALEKIGQFLRSEKQHYIVTPNPEIILKAQKDEEFREILNKASLLVPDGIGLVLASKFLGSPLKERITGVDLVYEISQKVAPPENNNRLFLIGGEEEIAKKAAENLVKKYPGLQIAGAEDGFRDLDVVVEKINKVKPEILLVGLGMVKQEKWIYENLDKMPSVKLAMGVGGTFDFISGRVKRAPKFIQKMGLEWLWRLTRQPWRIKRIYNAVVRFPIKIVKVKIG